MTLVSAGSATIFKRNTSSEVWEAYGAKLQSVNPAQFDQFGTSVSISGNYAFVGAPQDDGSMGYDQGSVVIFVKMGSIWKRLQTITDPYGSENDNLGASCAIDGSVKRFVIGLPGMANSLGEVIFGKFE